MPQYQYLRRVTYGPDKGGYEYRSYLTNRHYTAGKDLETGHWVLTVSGKDGDFIEQKRYRKVTECDVHIRNHEMPIADARRREQQAEQARIAEERRAAAEAAKAERLSKDSHRDSDVYIKSKITRMEAIKLAERLLHWAVDSNKHEPLDARCIDLNIYYTDSTRGAGWEQDEDDNRFSVGIGWHSSDDIYPVIEDSLIAKREKPEPVEVSESDDLGVAV